MALERVIMMKRTWINALSCLGVIVAFGLILSGCGVTITTNPGNGAPSAGTTSTASNGQAEPKWGMQARTSGCQVQGPLPDSACTPGDIIPTASKDQICQSGYSRSVRNVPQSVKTQAYDEYGIRSRVAGQYEVDHLVSLELGGSNSIANLWPEPASPQPGFHEKDRVENYLHDQVCSGAISLKDAQIEIATNWLTIYNRMPKQ